MKKYILLSLALSCFVTTAQAQNTNLSDAVRQGIRQSMEQTRNANWNEAFAICRQLDALLHNDTQTSKDPHYALHYLVAKERLRMYNRIRKPESGKQQLDIMQTYAVQSKIDTLQTDYWYAKAQYHQLFGQTAQSLESYKQWFARKVSGQSTDAIEQSYRNILDQAKQEANPALASSMQILYNHWKDSIRTAKDAATLHTLKQQYSESQQSLKEKEVKISTNKILIGLLGSVAAILAVAVIFLIFSLLRFIVKNKSLRRSLELANDNNNLKSQYINHISEQVEPTLADIRTKAADATTRENIDALLTLFNDVQTYIGLEETRDEMYPTEQINVCDFCKKLMEEAKVWFKPEVESVIKVPRVFIHTNAEALGRIIRHLLKNAAAHTQTGKITVEFKKRSAHTGQFLITDTGCGIAQALRPSLFKPFKAVEDLRKGDKLGLPICSLIAYKLNGELHIDNDFKKGTRFILELHAKLQA